MGKSFVTPEQRKIVAAMKQRAPGGCDWLKGTKYKAAQEADVAHQRRKRLYAEARAEERRADELEAEALRLEQQFKDAFGL